MFFMFSGLAYVESLCSDSSYSIVEDNESIAAITVPVHELAHRFVNNRVDLCALLKPYAVTAAIP